MALSRARTDRLRDLARIGERYANDSAVSLCVLYAKEDLELLLLPGRED
jgi:hypothetical protein